MSSEAIVTCGATVAIWLRPAVPGRFVTKTRQNTNGLVPALLECTKKPGHDGDHQQPFVWTNSRK